MKTMARKAKIPKESLLKVKEGCTAYKGVATSVKMAGEDIILMARTRAQLNIIWNKHFPAETLRADLCYEVVLTSIMYATLDEI